MIRAMAFMMALCASTSAAEEFPALYSVTGVASGDALNIRETPDGTAAILGALPPDATGVEVVAVEGDWALVNTPDRAGYVALQFLRREDGPSWNDLTTPLICLGTEPFWSLDIDPVAGIARYRTPEETEPRELALGQTWPGRPWAPSAAVTLPEGLAVLSPAECSDGMSERSYGIAADLFLGGSGFGSGQTRLSGCCLLRLP
jgi:uncharacterized membrane protein